MSGFKDQIIFFKTVLSVGLAVALVIIIITNMSEITEGFAPSRRSRSRNKVNSPVTSPVTSTVQSSPVTSPVTSTLGSSPAPSPSNFGKAPGFTKIIVPAPSNGICPPDTPFLNSSGLRCNNKCTPPNVAVTNAYGMKQCSDVNGLGHTLPIITGGGPSPAPLQIISQFSPPVSTPVAQKSIFDGPDPIINAVSKQFSEQLGILQSESIKQGESPTTIEQIKAITKAFTKFTGDYSTLKPQSNLINDAYDIQSLLSNFSLGNISNTTQTGVKIMSQTAGELMKSVTLSTLYGNAPQPSGKIVQPSGNSPQPSGDSEKVTTINTNSGLKTVINQGAGSELIVNEANGSKTVINKNTGSTTTLN